MIEILCFGDSNTYGFTPDWKHRYGRDIRYPGVLQAPVSYTHLTLPTTSRV